MDSAAIKKIDLIRQGIEINLIASCVWRTHDDEGPPDFFFRGASAQVREQGNASNCCEPLTTRVDRHSRSLSESHDNLKDSQPVRLILACRCMVGRSWRLIPYKECGWAGDERNGKQE